MHWCLGTYASASTWLFNVALQIAAVLNPSREVTSRFVVFGHELGFLRDAAGPVIVKTHDTDEVARAILSERAEAILLSIRDPRDSVASLLVYQKMPFDQAIDKVAVSAAFCAKVADHAKARLFRYEDGFFDDPVTIARVADTFGRAVAAADQARILAATRRDAVERLIAGLDTLPTVYHHADPLETLDLTTQWHRHHAGRTGEIGRWRRELTAEQVAAVEARLAPFIARFAYADV